MLQLNVRSALIGAFVAACLATAFSASAGSGIKAFRRYEIRTNPTHAFVLDTTTGRVWERAVSTDSKEVDRSFYRAKAR